MANDEHVSILKSGVQSWNTWRTDNPKVKPDLERASLIRADLRNSNLTQATLLGTHLSGADLRESCLDGANLSESDVCGADLSHASFVQANLTNVDLRHADLQSANLTHAILRGAQLSGANVKDADFRECTMGFTFLGRLDLSGSKNLQTVKHEGPSEIGIHTLYRSAGCIPQMFLRGAGVPETFIEYMGSLVHNSIEFHSCFISYSTRDQEFADRLHCDLQSRGVRCWFAPEDLKIGQKLRPAFDEAIQLHDKLMVVLSESSVKSPWVEKEVETAFEKEHQQDRTVLFPIRLDSAVMKTDCAWAADIRRTRNIGDFSHWKNHDSYKKALDRLIRDLKSEKSDVPRKCEGDDPP